MNEQLDYLRESWYRPVWALVTIPRYERKPGWNKSEEVSVSGHATREEARATARRWRSSHFTRIVRL